MSKVIIVNQEQDSLSRALSKQLPEAMIKNDFNWQPQDQDVICWLPADKSRVDLVVGDLVTMLDQNGVRPAKLVMKSVAGTADDAEPGQWQNWYGSDAQNVVMDHLYAIKMIDELEFPYTIVRSLPLTRQPVNRYPIEEGQPFQGSYSNLDQVANLLAQATQPDQYENQSVGI